MRAATTPRATSMTSRISFFMPAAYAPTWQGGHLVAEVDGNRTRRTGIARPTRFEGGGAHQVPGHLHPGPYR